MGFFDRPPPVARPEPERSRRPTPAWIKPEAALPGVVATELVLGRTSDAAVAVIGLSAYPTGFEFSVCAVVREPGQFAPSQMPGTYLLDDSAAFAAATAVAHRTLLDWAQPPKSRYQVVPGANYFVAFANANTDWLRGDPVATIGAHAFYREAL